MPGRTALAPSLAHPPLTRASNPPTLAQDQYLRQVAADASLWAPLALGRWPGADADAGYDGNWHALFLARAYMPHAFPLAADRVRAVTAVQRQQRQAEQHAAPAAVGAPSATSSSSSGSSGAGAMPALAFEDVMRQAFSVGLACTRWVLACRMLWAAPADVERTALPARA